MRLAFSSLLSLLAQPRLALVGALLLALVGGVQDVTGRLLHRQQSVAARAFMQQDGLAFRCKVPALVGLPERLAEALQVKENGWELTRSTVRATKEDGGGLFAWTGTNLWIAPRSAADPRTGSVSFELRVPLVLGWGVRCLVYLPLLGLLLWHGWSKPRRTMLSQALEAALRRLLPA